jgi:hypothetical protein
MPMNLIIHNIWELLDRFKNQCKLRNWEISEYEDWIKTSDGKYHNFLWIQLVHPSTFDRICRDYKVAIRDDISYRTVNVSYVAWLFLQSPTENMILKVKQNPEYTKRIAIYDLSRFFIDKSPCLNLNKTDSMVFREFEKFIECESGTEIEPIFKKPVLKMHPHSFEILR